MTDFIIKKPPYNLSSHAGLAFIGKYLKRVNVNALIDPKFPVCSGVANSEILKSYLGLLCLGKNDFDAIESFRGNAFFMRALGLGVVPSSPTLRHQAKRRRINTVMQELMFKAARMIAHAGRWVLGLGESDPAFAVFERHYAQLRAA